jgi:hypothetical protein
MEGESEGMAWGKYMKLFPDSAFFPISLWVAGAD